MLMNHWSLLEYRKRSFNLPGDISINSGVFNDTICNGSILVYFGGAIIFIDCSDLMIMILKYNVI